MKVTITTITMLAFFFVSPGVAQDKSTTNFQHIQQLLKTKKCPMCELKGADLRGANLQGADLHGANLVDSNLRGTILSNSNLNGANLVGADLTGANLSRADLTQANLRKANLSKATFSSNNWNLTATTKLSEIGEIINLFQLGLIAGIITFSIGIIQYSKEQRWKKNEVVANEIKEFESNPTIANVLKMLDWAIINIELVKSGEKDLITDDVLYSALLIDPLKFDGFSDLELLIRSSFDYFLDGLERFEHLIQAGLVNHKDFYPYLHYWIELLGNISNGRRSKKFYTTFWNYVNFYYCDLNYFPIHNLFKRYGYFIFPTIEKRKADAMQLDKLGILKENNEIISINSSFRIKPKELEIYYLLKGKAIVSSKFKQKLEIVKGDLLIVPIGAISNWKIIEEIQIYKKTFHGSYNRQAG